MNGKYLKIPNIFINNFIEYSGANIWTGERDEVELKKKIVKNLSLKFRWEINTSGNPINIIYIAQNDGRKNQNYVTVRIESLNRKTIGRENQVLTNFVNSALSNSNILQPKDIKHSYLGFDDKLLLFKATPVFDENEHVSLWNEDIYWEKDGNNVTTYIECDNNKLSNEFLKIRKCQIQFIDSDLMALVSIMTYRDNLTHWKEIKRSTYDLIHSFIIK